MDDARVLEIDAAAFKQLAAVGPRLLDHVTTVISSPQVGLDEARAAAVATIPERAPQSLLARMRAFLKV